jgi:hypothetical protein
MNLRAKDNEVRVPRVANNKCAECRPAGQTGNTGSGETKK